MRAGILTVVAVRVSAVTAYAQEKSRQVYGLSIPDRVGSLFYTRTVDFESKSPGLGYAIRLGRSAGLERRRLSLRSRPEVDSGRQRRSPYPQPAGGGEGRAWQTRYLCGSHGYGDFGVPVTGKPRFVCSGFGCREAERRDVEVESYLCLSSWNDNSSRSG